MNYVDELEAALARGYYHRRRRLPIAPIVGAALAAAVLVAAVIFVGGGDPPSERSVEPAQQAAADPTADLPTVAEYRAAAPEEEPIASLGVDEAGAAKIVAIPAPQEAEEVTWYVARRDEDDAVCLIAGKLTCVSPEAYAAGRLFDVSRTSVYGLAPRDVVRATIVNRTSYEEVQSFEVTDQVWQVPKAIDSPVVLVRADGTRFAADSGRPLPERGTPGPAPAPATASYSVLNEANIVPVPDELDPRGFPEATTPDARAYLVHDDARFREYVIVSSTTLCTLTVVGAGASGGGCGVDPTEFATEGNGPATMGQAGERELVTLLVPDGSSDVQLHFNDGSTEALMIEDNFAFAFVEKGVDYASWTSPDGTPIMR